jgi:hypothetical protein
MEKLKNCPNCGGVLDDTGRCMYCKSKVYDLTDINIDMNSNDIMLMKVKHGDQTIIMKVRPVNMSIKMEPSYDELIAMNGIRRFMTMGRNDVTIDLELKGC